MTASDEFNKNYRNPDPHPIDALMDVTIDPVRSLRAWTALTDGRWKYVFLAYEGREQLFDLAADPGELHDLADTEEHAQELERWRERMAAHLTPRGETWVREARPSTRRETILYGPNYPR